MEHPTFYVNQQYIWITYLGLENGVTRFVTRDVYVIVITQVELDYVGNIFHPNLFYFCSFYYIFNVHNHMHWILENEYLGFMYDKGCWLPCERSQKEISTHGVMDNMGVMYPQYWL